MSCVNCLVHIIHQWEQLKKLVVSLLTAKIEHAEVFLCHMLREEKVLHLCGHLHKFQF